MIDAHSNSATKKKQNHLLGDYTLYRVNKEFENFWRTDIQDNMKYNPSKIEMV